MVIYGTFDGFKNYREAPNKFIWKNVVDEMGNSLSGIYLSEKDLILKGIRMTFGNRYKLTGKEIVGNDVMGVSHLKQMNKNPRCDVFRKFKDEYHIISGKYQGKKNIDISDYDMSMYCIWLAKNTDNEATITNTLEILKKIHDER
jgi:hypothetical protein